MMRNSGQILRLREVLGEIAFAALIDPRNFGLVREFVQRELLPASLPDTFSVGSNRYEVLSPLYDGEQWIDGSLMIERAGQLCADLGSEHGQYFLDRREEIPREFASLISFVLPGWRKRGVPDQVAVITTLGTTWTQEWVSLKRTRFSSRHRLLRRIFPA
jgi:hypothetical protein